MALTIDIPNGPIQLSGNPVYVEVETDLAQGELFDKILLRITSADDAIEGGPWEMEIAPDESGISVFDISSIVDAPLDYNFAYPATQAMVEHDLLAFDITLEVAENYFDEDGILTQSEWEQETELVILKGGLAAYNRIYYSTGGRTFYDDFIAAEKFLTWMPESITMPPEGGMKLWYIYTGETAATQKLQINKTWLLNKTASFVRIEFTANPGSLYEINIVPSLLEIDMEDGEDRIIQLDALIVDASNEAVTEIKYFLVDYEYHENTNWLYFTNSLAGIDALWLTGELEYSHASSRETYTRPPRQTDAYTDATIVGGRKIGQRKWKLNTGYKTSDEIQFLKELFNSDKVWYIETVGSENRIVPVEVVNDENILNDTSVNLHSLEIEVREAHKEKYY